MRILDIPHLLLLSGCLLLLLVGSEAARDVISIDTFETRTEPLLVEMENTQTEDEPAYLIENLVSGKGIEGKWRDMLFNVTSAKVGETFESSVMNEWFTEFPARAEASILLQYDGSDETAYLDPTGLGGVDLGKHGADAIHLTLVATTHIDMRVVVYDMDGRIAESRFRVGDQLFDEVYLSYDDFLIIHGGELQWHSVGAIEVFADSPSDSDTNSELTVVVLACADVEEEPSPVSDPSPLSPALREFEESREHQNEVKHLPMSVVVYTFSSLLTVIFVLGFLGLLAVGLLLVFQRTSRNRIRSSAFPVEH